MLKRSLIILLICCPGLLLARVLMVGHGQSYQTIREGIAASKRGDTLLVQSGLYPENQLLVEHPLTLLGEGKPEIDGQRESEILTIKADSVLVDGFVFRGSGLSHLDENAAIRLEETRGGTIRNNVFLDNFFAIYVSESSECLISDNVIRGQAKTESRSGNAIHLWYCKDVKIQANQISGHRDGIYLEFVEQAEVLENQSSENLRYGLHFMFSNHNSYHHNTFIKNGAGVAVMYSRHVDMEENLFAENWGSAAYGLLLKDIYDSNILGNRFEGNTVGLYSEACNRVDVRSNLFQSNGWAIKIMANSMDNHFRGNDFLANTFDVSTNSRQNFNSFHGNYWSRYRGYDMDRDGIGDVPYRPVKLFSLLTEKNEPALMLMRSIFVELLDLAESYIPILTPATLIDEKPLMRRRS